MSKRSILTTVLAAALLGLSVASAQTSDSGQSAPSASTSEPASGEVRRIDKAQKKITLRHGEIRSLDMPPMSMVFRVRPDDLIDAVKVGDKMQFTVVKDPDGSLVVTSIMLAP